MNLEELNLSGNNMGGTITSDVAVFTKLKKLELNRMRLDGKMVVPGLAASYVADFHVFFATGPPLHESIKLLSPLTNLEELSLGGNKLGGTITSDVAVFTKLKKLKLHSMELDGKIGSTRSERFSRATETDIVFAQGLCQRCFQLR